MQCQSPHISRMVSLPGQHSGWSGVVQFLELVLFPPPQVREQGPGDQWDQPPSPKECRSILSVWSHLHLKFTMNKWLYLSCSHMPSRMQLDVPMLTAWIMYIVLIKYYTYNICILAYLIIAEHECLHGQVKQGTVLLVAPLQSLPPFWGGGLSHVLLSIRKPFPPQVMEHVPLIQGDQPPSMIPANKMHISSHKQNVHWRMHEY